MLAGCTVDTDDAFGARSKNADEAIIHNTYTGLSERSEGLTLRKLIEGSDAAAPDNQLRGAHRLLWDVGTQQPFVALSFDDGPDPRPTGPHTVWTNKISLKGRSYSQGSDTFFQIFSIPPAPVRYTTDGSDPLSRGVPYNGDFIVPPGTKIVAAVAEKDGVVSSVVNFPVDAKPSDNIRPDEAVDWHCRKRYQNLPISEGFQVLEYAREFRGGLSAVMITVVSADTDETLMYTLPDGQFKTPEEIIDLVEKLTALVPRANLTLTIGEISFSRGQDLLDWVKKNRLDLDYSREVRQ